MTYRGVEICFARSCKHQQNRVASFSCFFLVFFVFTPTDFTVAELCDDNACTGLITFSIVRKKEMVRKWSGNVIVQPARSPIYVDSMLVDVDVVR